MKLFSIVLTILYILVTLGLAILLYSNKSGIDLNPNIVVTAIAGTVTLGGFVLQKQFEREKLIEQQIRDKKIPIYTEFTNFFIDTITNPERDEKEMVDFFHEFGKKSIIWFSDGNLKVFISWIEDARRGIETSGLSATERAIANFLIVEKLIFGMRNEIGHPNHGLKSGDLLSIYINDLDKKMVERLTSKIPALR